MNEQLKKVLEEQKKNSFIFENIDKKQLLDTLLPEIGIQDSYIRCSLVFSNLFHLFNDNHFSNEELEFYARKLISDEYLFFDMENKNEYSVLKRTFTLLQLVPIIAKYRDDKIFNDDLLIEIYDRVIEYYKSETILIAHDPIVGWIDSIPHSADVLDELAQCEVIKDKEMNSIFYAVADKFKTTYPFTVTEDERTTTCLVVGIRRFESIRNGLKEWLDYLLDCGNPKEIDKRIYLHNNIKNLLRSMYFRLIDDGYDDLLIKIKNAIFQINKGHY